MAEPWTDEELAFLGEAFDLARRGRGRELIDRVRRGLPVDLTNAAGDTLLLLAAYHGHHDTVVALLAEGADTGRVNDRGQTALAAAVFRQDVAATTALLAAGADPNTGERSAETIARFFALDEMADLLRSGGGDSRAANP